MNDRDQAIAEVLRIAPGECIAIIGAGGKTTLLLALAGQLKDRGLKVLVSTTTRIWPPEKIPLVLEDDEPDPGHAIARHFGQGGAICCIGSSVSPEGKLIGVTAERACRLFVETNPDLMLIEADGAAGKLVKAHGPEEPVVPACSNRVMVVAGLAALGRPVGPETVHRLPEFCRLTKTVPGDIIRPAHIATCLAAAARHAPAASRVDVVVTEPATGCASPAFSEAIAEISQATGRSVYVARAGCLRAAACGAPVGGVR